MYQKPDSKISGNTYLLVLKGRMGLFDEK